MPTQKERPQRLPDNHGNADVLAKSAKTRQSEQGDVKEEGIDLLVMPDDCTSDCRSGGFAASSRYAVW